MPLVVGLVSDSSGETAEAMLRAALAQFPGLDVAVVPFRQVQTAEKVRDAVHKASESSAKLIISTLVKDDVRLALLDAANEAGIPAVHLLQPLLGALEQVSGAHPIQSPGTLRKVDESYFRRVKAMEYTIACDDGRSPQLLPQADIVLFGVSRAGKTPLSLFLANKGISVANVPLLPGVEPDERVWNVPVEKRVGLLISASRLREIRSQRLVLLGLDPQRAAYASLERITEELTNAKVLMEKLKCRIYDSTDRPVELLAQEIMFDLHLAEPSFF